MACSASSSKTDPRENRISGKVAGERRMVGRDAKRALRVHDAPCAATALPRMTIAQRLQRLQRQLAGGVARQPLDQQQRSRQEHGIDAPAQVLEERRGVKAGSDHRGRQARRRR